MTFRIETAIDSSEWRRAATAIAQLRDSPDRANDLSFDIAMDSLYGFIEISDGDEQLFDFERIFSDVHNDQYLSEVLKNTTDVLRRRGVVLPPPSHGMWLIIPVSNFIVQLARIVDRFTSLHDNENRVDVLAFDDYDLSITFSMLEGIVSVDSSLSSEISIHLEVPEFLNGCISFLRMTAQGIESNAPDLFLLTSVFSDVRLYTQA